MWRYNINVLILNVETQRIGRKIFFIVTERSHQQWSAGKSWKKNNELQNQTTMYARVT